MKEEYELSTPPRRGVAWKKVLAPALWLATGAALSWLVLGDPLGLGSGAPAPAHEENVAAGEAEAEPDRLWTCSMHPHVLAHEPGPCPLCGMDLVAVEAAPAEPPAAGATAEREILFYRNPMDPSVTSPVPAEDEMGMAYVPVYADQAAGGGSPSAPPPVVIDPALVQNMNVRTAVAGRGSIVRQIRTVGYLEYDQQRMVTITTKYSGWIEKVHVNYVGQKVAKGQPLFEIYSPELVQTEQELLSALDYARRIADAPEEVRQRAEGLVRAARARLSYWDITDEQVRRLEETGEVVRTLTVTAPAGGVVMKRLSGLEGMAVQPGMELFHIAGLSSLWVSVELFEGQLAFVTLGSRATISLSYFPGESFEGRVRIIEPEVSEATRTVPVLVEVPNRGGHLRAGMYATVVFEPVTAEGVVTVPSEAVLRTGQRDLVVVEVDRGRFVPREVVLGHAGRGEIEVRRGLEEGERVVVSAQFLIDSEAKLQEAIRKLLAAREG